MANSISPNFVHDCDCCEFRGYLHGQDVYRHGDTVIIRFGDDGPDYRSFDKSIIKCLPAENQFRAALRMCEGL